jgi:hypothetical protein
MVYATLFLSSVETSVALISQVLKSSIFAITFLYQGDF